MDSNPLTFIPQSTRSNYCGVYSTGMLLSLLGIPTTRSEALALFDLKRNNPNFAGAIHEDIGNIFAKMVKVRRWRWEYKELFDFAWVSASLFKSLQLKERPTLLSFGAIHKNNKWRCTHVVVAVSIAEKIIGLLDPLGKRPAPMANANTWLKASNGPKSVHVQGGLYSIDLNKEVAVLQWTN